MPDPNLSRPVRQSVPLAGAPVIRRGCQWWLVTSAGPVLATDPAITSELDRFATALAAADHEVARLRALRNGEA
ncbi:hypothetical protein [Kitasatospora sp. NPDC051914]|uniref:hypothetical protein n=1 Tax=Kitasatospora sp. NPDC051914 TaxID=3154945 RepID=UPI00341A9EEA